MQQGLRVFACGYDFEGGRIYQVCWGKIDQVLTRGRENYIHGFGEEYNVVKRERGSNIIFPIIFRLLGRISIREEGKGTEIFGMKIKSKRMGIGTNIKLRGTLYTSV